jgi:hypothetical protein
MPETCTKCKGLATTHRHLLPFCEFCASEVDREDERRRETEAYSSRGSILTKPHSAVSPGQEIPIED